MVYGGVAGATRPCSGPYHIREVVGEKCEYTLIYDPLYALLFRRRIVLKQKNTFVGVNLRLSHGFTAAYELNDSVFLFRLCEE